MTSAYAAQIEIVYCNRTATCDHFLKNDPRLMHSGNPFFRATDSLDFELIETTRIVGTLNWMDDDDYDFLASLSPEEREILLGS
jgi:hypothetical protein